MVSARNAATSVAESELDRHGVAVSVSGLQRCL